MIRWEEIGEVRILRAGKGEWYNHSHNQKWDMGEDAKDLPSPNWHIELQKACEELENSFRRLIVDLKEMYWLVGHDWGFLLRMSEQLSSKGIDLVIVANDQIIQAAIVLQLGDKIKTEDSVEGAL
jgi:hypothetical protein